MQRLSVLATSSFVYGYFPLMRGFLKAYVEQMLGFLTSVCVCFLLLTIVRACSTRTRRRTKSLSLLFFDFWLIADVV